MEIAKRLRELRESHGYKQETVANFLHMSRQGYGRYEQGNGSPTIDMLAKIAQFYQVPLESLIPLYEYNIPTINQIAVTDISASPYTKDLQNVSLPSNEVILLISYYTTLPLKERAKLLEHMANASQIHSIS